MSQKGPSRHLTSLQNLLRGSNNPYLRLSQVRQTLPKGDFAFLVSWLPHLYRAGKPVFQGQYPSRISQLRVQSEFDPIDSRLEVIWAALMFGHHAKQINTFVSLRKDFEGELASGSFIGSLGFLTEIEKCTGQSLWSIENRIALLQLGEGLEKQKAYANKIRAEGAQPLVGFIAYYISQRNEGTATPSRFIKSVTEMAVAAKAEESLYQYVMYRLCNQIPGSEEGVSNILRMEAPSSIVDYYDTFIRLAQASILNNPRSSVSLEFISQLIKLEQIINDHRIHKLLFLTENPGNSLSTQDISALDMALGESWDRTATLASQIRQKEPDNADNWYTEAMALNEINKEGPDGKNVGAEIIRRAIQVYGRTGQYTDAIIELNRLALNFRLLGFSSSIENFINLESSPNPVDRPYNGLKAFIDHRYLSPTALICLPSPKLRERYGSLLREQYPSSPTVVLVLMREGFVSLATAQDWLHRADPISQDHVVIAEIEQHILSNDVAHALRLTETLERSDRSRVRRLAVRFKSYCLLQLNYTDELIEHVVENALIDPSMIPVLPLGASASLLNVETRRRLQGNLSVPILLDLYSRQVSEALNNERSDAYEDFLMYHELEKPSQLLKQINDFPRSRLVYYLRHICIPSIMEVSIAYSSSRELQDERLAVARILTHIDPINAQIYEEEIRSITRNQIVQQGVRHVEQSKIFVDTPALRNWAKENLNEDFLRYRALLKAGIVVEGHSFAQIYKDLRAGMPPPQDFLQIPKDEASELLIGFVLSLLNQFAFNPKHGLDCYLSMRIRHGTLSGQLRSPLEMEKIITKRQTDASGYKENQYWIERLNHLDWTIAQAVGDCLTRFSRDYDLFIDGLAKDLIQIRREEKKHGLFIMSLDAIQIRYIASRITEETTFDMFFDEVVPIFWEVVKKSLTTICNVIDTTLKLDMTKLFVRLEEEIANETDSGTVIELTRSIRIAQTNAQLALSREKEWFHLIQPMSIPPLSFETLIEIGVQSVKNLHREFDPVVSIAAPIPVIQGGLNEFSDMFFIIFENIQRHCGIEGKPRVLVTMQDYDDKIRILIRNDISAEVRTDEAEEKVARIKKLIEDGSYQSGVNSEGGTGFIKLRKRIDREGASALSLDFGFTQDNMFFVDFEVPLISFDGDVTQV